MNEENEKSVNEITDMGISLPMRAMEMLTLLTVLTLLTLLTQLISMPLKSRWRL